LALLALWLFAIFDVIATDSSLCRNLPKMGWLFIVLILPDVGAIAWLLLGRPVNAGFHPGSTAIRPTRFRAVGPEDSPNYTSRSEDLNRRLDEWENQQRRKNVGGSESRDLTAWEEDLRRREEELRRKEQGPGELPPPPG